MFSINHTSRKKTMLSSLDNTNGTSACTPIKERMIVGTAILSTLVDAIIKLKPLEFLDLRQNEDEFLSKACTNPSVHNDYNLNLRKFNMRKHRENLRNKLLEGIPYDAVHSHKHYFNNRKLSVCVVFAVEKEHVQQQATEGVKSCSDCNPDVMSRA